MKKNRSKRILWKIFPVFLGIAVFILAAITWYSTQYFEKIVYQETQKTLRDEAEIIDEMVHASFTEGDYTTIDRRLKSIGRNTARRFSIILPDGQVVCDSSEDISTLENHKNRPEIIQVLQTNAPAIAQRYSRTLRTEALYVAIPIFHEDSLLAVIRASVPMDSLRAASHRFYIQIIIGCFSILAVVSVGCYFLYRWLTTPLEALRDGIERLSEGQLTHRVSVPDGDFEISDITRAVNDMASQLNDRFRSLEWEQKEKETIITSLFDGILVVDCNEEILNLNHVAESILDISAIQSKGQKLASQVRNSALVELVRTTIRDKCSSTKEIVFRSHREEFYQVDCIPVRESAFSIRKILIVLHNVTQSKRIQSNRRNVIMQISHQLKQPATRIIEVANTMAGSDVIEIANNATLQIAILNDLIYLTEIEESIENQKFEHVQIKLDSLFQDAIDIVREPATKKGVTVTLSGQATSIGDAPALLQMALRLINNSLTYTPHGGRVTISVRDHHNHSSIEVNDTGIGIPDFALKDIFKPFYRINTPEHQAVKGGGLGLAIVKLIVDAHKGHLDVESSYGKGAKFTIRLPHTHTGEQYVIPTQS